MTRKGYQLLTVFPRQALPRDGSVVLSDLRDRHLTIVCDLCASRGRYSVFRLMQQHSDVNLTDLLVTLVKCHRAGSSNVYDRCGARFATLN
jgi:hypothetical protein